MLFGVGLILLSAGLDLVWCGFVVACLVLFGVIWDHLGSLGQFGTISRHFGPFGVLVTGGGLHAGDCWLVAVQAAAQVQPECELHA